MDNFSVGKKVSVCRHHQPQDEELDFSILTGSWGDEANEVSVTRFSGSEGQHVTTHAQAHAGNVTELRFVRSDVVLASSSRGNLTSYNVVEDAAGAELVSDLTVAVHEGSCTAFDVHEFRSEVVTSGEDGCITVHAATTLKELRRIDRASSSSLHSVRWCGQHTVAGVGLSGRLSVWDMQASGRRPVIVSHDPNSSLLTCLAKLPTRPHHYATGSADGVVSVWDARASTTPIFSTRAHDGPVWDACFLPTAEQCIASCGEDGTVKMLTFTPQNGAEQVTYDKSEASAVELLTSVQPLNRLDFVGAGTRARPYRALGQSRRTTGFGMSDDGDEAMQDADHDAADSSRCWTDALLVATDSESVSFLPFRPVFSR